jgi:hypothetical protein
MTGCPGRLRAKRNLMQNPLMFYPISVKKILIYSVMTHFFPSLPDKPYLFLLACVYMFSTSKCRSNFVWLVLPERRRNGLHKFEDVETIKLQAFLNVGAPCHIYSYASIFFVCIMPFL